MRIHHTCSRRFAPIYARRRPELAALLVVLLTACPGPGPGDSDGSTTLSTDSTTSGATTSGATTSGATTSGATTSSTTPTSTTPTSTTGGEASTTGGTTGDTDAIDVTCTYPGSTSAGPASPDLAPECACIDAQGELLCKAGLCPTITGECSENGFGSACEGTWSYNAAAVQCALEAARDGTEGTIAWYFSPNQGFSSFSGFLHIVPDRRVIRQDNTLIDLGGEVSDTELWQLQDPQYFQGCLELATLCEQMDCLFAGTSGSALSLCLPGFNYDGI